MQPTLASSSNEWQLDKILTPSRWPARLFWGGWGLALLAIGVTGLPLLWKGGLLILMLVIMLLSYRHRVRVRAISVSKSHCTLRLVGGKHIELTPPYRASYMLWWISLNHREGYTGRWLWLYRDQFTASEWRQLMTLLRWS